MVELASQYVTRYMGSKIRLLDFVVPPILDSRNQPFTFVDLMAGTHAVGHAVRGFATVVANDVQYYSQVFGRALISNSTIASVDSKTLAYLATASKESIEPGWFTATYADTYFAHSQCLEIERIRALIHTVHEEPLQSILLTALAHAMGHAQSSPGHFAQYMPASHPRVQALRDISVRESFLRYLSEFSVSTVGTNNTVHQSEIHDFLADPPVCDVRNVVAYLDPPYSPAQYSRYYHLLDTVMLDDQPEVAHKGLYRPDRFSSLFSSEARVYSQFARVLRRIAELGWDLAISYGTHALLPIGQLEGLARLHFSSVSTSIREYAHSMQGRGVAKDRSEVLLMCRL